MNTQDYAARLEKVKSADDKQHEAWHRMFGDECRRGPACPMYRKAAQQ